MKRIIQVFFLVFVICVESIAQVQKGNDIDGSASNLRSGFSVSMSDDDHVAIGAPNFDEGRGQVQVYSWIDSAWEQKGSDINGDVFASFSHFGWSVSMPDSYTIGVSAPSVYESNTGYVKIYEWNGVSWLQKGSNIIGQNWGGQFGYSISMPDANTVAIGANTADYEIGLDVIENAGRTCVYAWDGQSWGQIGSDIVGESAGDQSGYSVSMPNSSTVAIGAIGNDANGGGSGHVRVFSWNGNVWSQKGGSINGEAFGDQSGYSVSMPDENTVAIGAIENDNGAGDAGHVRVFEWNDNSWIQKGLDIDGISAGEYSGCSVSMPNSNYIAIGAKYSSVLEANSGLVRLYSFDGSNWVQLGSDIYGSIYDRFGTSVSMPDENTFVAGAPFSNANGNQSGQVQIFNISVVGLNSVGAERVLAYPNPTSRIITIELNKNHQQVHIALFGPDGKKVRELDNVNSDRVAVNLSGLANGLYLLSIQSEAYLQLERIVKI